MCLIWIDSGGGGGWRRGYFGVYRLGHWVPSRRQEDEVVLHIDHPTRREFILW